MTAAAPASPGSIAPAPSAIAHRPLLGVLAVLIGAFISTFNIRFTSVGLSDARGGLALGFDEGSWFVTAATATQVGLCASAAWLTVVFGPRRLLLWAATIFAIASVLPPLTRDPHLLTAIQMVRGLAVGVFIPATVGFILHSLPPRWWAWGLGAYAFRFVFSQNITTAIQGFYGEHGLWPWIFWQNTALTAVMIGLIWFGMPRQPVNRALVRGGDWTGVALVGLGLMLIYAALSQGNRLDWLESGVIVGLLAGGGLCLAAFLVHAFTAAQPFLDLRIFRSPDLLVPPLLIGIYGFGTTATSFVLPDYLTRVQGLRPLQAGDVLNWVALPQLVLVPLVVWLLRYVDARLMLAIGLALIAVGSWMNTGLTHAWVNADFVASQLVEAVGLALGITSLIFFVLSHVTIAQAITVGGIIQASRMLGAEAGSAFIQTYVRVREQIASNLIGLHVGAGDDKTETMAAMLSQMIADRDPSGDSAGQSLLALGNLVRREAYVLAYIDAYWVIAWTLTLSLLLVLVLRPAQPNPLTRPWVRA